MGRIGALLQQRATSPSPRLTLGESARAISSASLAPFVSVPRAIRSELVRLGTQTAQLPTFQTYAPALGSITRQPLETLRLPTGLTAGLLPGTVAGAVARDLERETQDRLLAATADQLAYGLGIGTARASVRGLSRIGQVLRSRLTASGLVAPEILGRPLVPRPVQPSRGPVTEAELVEPPRALTVQTGEGILAEGGPRALPPTPQPLRPLPPQTPLRPPAVAVRPPSVSPSVAQVPLQSIPPSSKAVVVSPVVSTHPVIPPDLPQKARLRVLEQQLAQVDKQMRGLEQQRISLVRRNVQTGRLDAHLQELSKRFNGLEANLSDLLVGNARELARQLERTQSGVVKLGELSSIEQQAQQRLNAFASRLARLQQRIPILEAKAQQRSQSAFQRGDRQATIREKKLLIEELRRQFRLAAPIIRAAQRKALTPSQVFRLARTQRIEVGKTVVGPRGGLKEAPLEPEEIKQVKQRIGGVVPRGITEAQRQRLATGQPTRLPGGPNVPPPIIPMTTALVPSELRPQRDVPVSFTRATAEVDIQRAAQVVDGSALGPVNRSIVQPAIQADARAVTKAQRKLAEFRTLARGIKKDSELDAKILRAVEDRTLPTDTLSQSERQLVEMWKTFAKVAIEEEINPVLVTLGKKPIAPRQNYAPHLSSLSFLSDLFGALERIPDELLERLPILKSVMETPIGQRDPSLPQPVRDLPYIPKHPSAFFLKPRIGGPFRESLIAGIEAYVPLWARITEVAPVAQSIKPMLSQMPPNFRAMAEQWLGELLGKRPRADVLDSKALRDLARIQRLTSSSLILARTTTILLQYSSLANIAARHGWFYTMRGLGRALTSQGRAFAELFSRELQQRMAVGTLLEGDKPIFRIANAGLEFTDQQMVTAAFLTAFEHYTKMPAGRFQQLAGTSQTFEAIVNLANISTEQTQSSMRRALQSPVLRSQLLRATTSQLQTFNVNLRQQQFLDPRILAMSTSRKEAAAYVARLDADLLMMNMIYRFFGLRPPADVGDLIPIFDPWTGAVPIGVIWRAVESKGRFVPASALLATALFKVVTDAKEDGKLNANTMRTLAKALMLPIPGGSQIATSIDGAIQAFQGGRRNRRDPTRFDYRIDNPIDAVKAITLGPTFTRGYQAFRERGFKPEPLTREQQLLRKEMQRVRRQLFPNG